jgi:hypothetical protein
VHTIRIGAGEVTGAGLMLWITSTKIRLIEAVVVPGSMVIITSEYTFAYWGVTVPELRAAMDSANIKSYSTAISIPHT